ncbi:hypothetical protein HHI36_010320 [Cryptolaemus montrouzieri]|uniref:NADH dehydrogenase [ubiquinone] 1 alpha subcomplex subunit 10, mitochondrial n=1 Tax=Cryptolaemus montrouzieri TaxID=559131 RepID=A0ABD2MID0_9CUCU
MASLVRLTLRNLGNTELSKQLLAQDNFKLVRTITSKLLKVESKDIQTKPKPWPYKEKRYTFLHQFIDKTTARFDDNSKIIVVEGPVAAGKTAFAKQLADDLEMLYLPEANLDMHYINDYGFDLRTLDNQLPESCRSFDINNFLISPRHSQVALFQIKQYTVKFEQYIDALAHVLSTGQGVVLDRCCYSDFVFTEAMYSQGYISKGAYDAYYAVRKNTIIELLRPHLLIYLDVSVPQIQANIQKRALSYEVKSPALTKEYLTEIEKQYKQNYLKEMSKHSELLIYDWSDGGDPEVVVEDIERIDFDNYDAQDVKMKDWDHYNEEDWAALRRKYCNTKDNLLNLTNVPAFDVPELVIDAEDADVMHHVLNNAPGNEYDLGFNSRMGDKNLLLKVKGTYLQTLPLRERRAF